MKWFGFFSFFSIKTSRLCVYYPTQDKSGGELYSFYEGGELYVSFCLMKNARRCVNCHAQVTPRTKSCTNVHRTTRALVVSDWSRNSASRS